MTNLKHKSRHFSVYIFGALLFTFSGLIQAEPYPNESVRLTVGFGPGGPSDIAARFMQRNFESVTGEKLVIQNKPGAGGALSWSQINDDPADGYHLTLLNFPHINLQPLVLDGNAGYTIESITPIIFYTAVPQVLAVRKESPIKSFEDFTSTLKNKPDGGITVGGVGIGGSNHAMWYLFNKEAAVKTTYIPFSDTATAMMNLKGGVVDVAWTFSTQGVQDGEDIRLLAVAAEERMPIFPDVPTLKELGHDVVDSSWWAIGVPNDTPENKRKQIEKTFIEVLSDPMLQKNMSKAGYMLNLVGYDHADKFMHELQKKYAPVAPNLKSEI